MLIATAPFTTMWRRVWFFRCRPHSFLNTSAGGSAHLLCGIVLKCTKSTHQRKNPSNNVRSIDGKRGYWMKGKGRKVRRRNKKEKKYVCFFLKSHWELHTYSSFLLSDNKGKWYNLGNVSCTTKWFKYGGMQPCTCMHTHSPSSTARAPSFLLYKPSENFSNRRKGWMKVDEE